MGKIEQLTGLKRSPTQIRKYLLNIGFKFRQVGIIHHRWKGKPLLSGVLP